jgi:hypothetical protein
MWFELGVSQIFTQPAQLNNRIIPKTFMTGSAGMGIRLQESDVMIIPVGKFTTNDLSASSHEEFAGSLQALGRAMIIGSQTPGTCLVMNIELLPKDAILSYPFGQSQTPDECALEDNGDVPDIQVALHRQVLLQGIDAQLQTAMECAAESGDHAQNAIEQ